MLIAQFNQTRNAHTSHLTVLGMLGAVLLTHNIGEGKKRLSFLPSCHAQHTTQTTTRLPGLTQAASRCAINEIAYAIMCLCAHVLQANAASSIEEPTGIWNNSSSSRSPLSSEAHQRVSLQIVTNVSDMRSTDTHHLVVLLVPWSFLFAKQTMLFLAQAGLCSPRMKLTS
jgi:hypothetical protein